MARGFSMSLGWFRRVLAVGAGLAVALTGGVVSPAHAQRSCQRGGSAAAVTSVEHPRFLSFTPSVGRVSENDPYVVLEARLDGHTPSGQHMAIYDVHARTLIRTCTGYACSATVRTTELESEAYAAYVVTDGDIPQDDIPAAPLAISRAVHVTNVGWVPPVSVVSFVASVTQVSENAPYSYLRITWITPCRRASTRRCMTTPGRWRSRARRRRTAIAGCVRRMVRRGPKGVCGSGSPAATGGPVNPLWL